MIKLLIPAALVLLILAAIIYFTFNPSQKSGSTQNGSSGQTAQTRKSYDELKIEDVNIKDPPEPIYAELFKPGQTKASGYVRLSQVAGKVLIQLKSDDASDKTGMVFKGSCAANSTDIIYPLASLKEGKSQTIWETDLESIFKQFPLSVKTFKDIKNLKNYTLCADLK